MKRVFVAIVGALFLTGACCLPVLMILAALGVR